MFSHQNRPVSTFQYCVTLLLKVAPLATISKTLCASVTHGLRGWCLLKNLVMQTKRAFKVNRWTTCNLKPYKQLKSHKLYLKPNYIFYNIKPCYVTSPSKGGSQLTLASVWESRNISTWAVALAAPARRALISPDLSGKCITCTLGRCFAT